MGKRKADDQAGSSKSAKTGVLTLPTALFWRSCTQQRSSPLGVTNLTLC